MLDTSNSDWWRGRDTLTGARDNLLYALQTIFKVYINGPCGFKTLAGVLLASFLKIG